MLQIQGILTQYLKFNQPMCPIQFDITFEIKHIIVFSRFIRQFGQNRIRNTAKEDTHCLIY